MKKSLLLIVLIIFLVLGLPLYFFFLNFKGQHFSEDTSNWSDFGSYVSSAAAVCNLIIFVFLTLELQRYNEKEGEHQKALQKPIISFFRPDNISSYAIENVGAGTALNIIIRWEYDEETKNYNRISQGYCLRSGAVGGMRWSEVIKEFAVQYDDVFGNRYYSYFNDDHLQFFPASEGEKFPFEYQKVNIPISINF